MAATTSILDLPDEIIQQILFHISPQDTLLNVALASKRLARISNEPLLWRYHCRMSYKYWDSRHRIAQKFTGGVGNVDWKKLFFYRRDVDHQTTSILDSILSEQIKRIEKFESIGKFGYDAKDTLLRHCQADDGADDVLARRFYSNAVLDHLHRSKALEEWSKLNKGGYVPLERALGAFDMFVLHDYYGDLTEISDMLDRITHLLRAENPNLDNLSPRRKALTVATFLRANNLMGLASDLRYRDLKNTYIGVALQDEEHPSLPLISVAIYCAVAQRVGLDARCCAFPEHVHAIVSPQESETLDGQPTSSNNEPAEPMYLDPYRTDAEVPVDHLKPQLLTWGITDFQRYLRDASTRTIVLRTSRNILATVHDFRGIGGTGDNVVHSPIRMHANPFADIDHAFYSALWANFILCTLPSNVESIDLAQLIALMLERFETLYPMDAVLIERYVIPLSRNLIAGDPWDIMDRLRVVRVGDAIPKQVRLRDHNISDQSVKFRVGQVFQHRRYGYTAVIIGWDVECNMTPQWIAQNQVDRLSRGRHQSFYHALVEDTSIRYVAEENIEIVEPEVPLPLMSLAGRFFKRWDRESYRFVSNIRDEYPDD